ncbi:MAG: hypothetical protein M1327_06655 [Candidatus Thermoplasmatota archaeon]|nr:hypothetical protein [Candidatus Thermoplasmatota archaeon]
MTLSEVVATTLEVINNRKVSESGKNVTYDLRSLRFSSKRIASRTLCETLWKLDISKWIDDSDDPSKINPETNLNLIVSKDQLPGMRRAINKMMEDLGRTKTDRYIKTFMKDVNSSDSGLRAILLVGLVNGVLIKNSSVKKLESSSLNAFIEKLQDHIKIVEN